jgi:hypothetical protein
VIVVGVRGRVLVWVLQGQEIAIQVVVERGDALQRITAILKPTK